MEKLRQTEWLQQEQGEGEADCHEHPQSGNWTQPPSFIPPFYSACDADPWDSAIHTQGGSPLPSHTSAELPSWACSETRVTITGVVSTALLMNNRQIRLCAAALVTIFCCPVWLAKCTPLVTSVCPTFFPTYWGHFPPKLARPHLLDGHRHMSIHPLFCSLLSYMVLLSWVTCASDLMSPKSRLLICQEDGTQQDSSCFAPSPSVQHCMHTPPSSWWLQS